MEQPRPAFYYLKPAPAVKRSQRLLLSWLFVTTLAQPTVASGAAIRDDTFPQPIRQSLRLAAELQGAKYRRIQVDIEGTVFVLTDRGVCRLFEDTLALDRSFRPLAGQVAADIALRQGRLYHLFADRFLCNDFSGEPLVHLPAGRYQQFAVAHDGTVLLSAGKSLSLWQKGQLHDLTPALDDTPLQLLADDDSFLVLTSSAVYRCRGSSLAKIHTAAGLTAIVRQGPDLILGSHQGYYSLDAESGAPRLARQTKVPCLDVTCLATAADGLWVGTTRGAYLRRADGSIHYLASRRWLRDDRVVDLRAGRDHDVFVLTETGLNRIEYRPMSLEAKAAHYEEKIRRRHLRFGLIAELRLTRPGDPSSAEMIDTDNDGSWSSYYMASQAFRFAVTGDPEAHRHAWETFAAMERLQTINGRDGFPSRTFERRGFKYSDPDRWHVSADGDWDWKAHTSSDEIIDHTFGYAVLYECAARTPAEKARITSVFTKILDHIIAHNWYLVDVDGKPTLWGRWNPEYVNWYPTSIIDRRLNSAEITAMLQLAYKMTGREDYKRKAYELFEKHGYLDNILASTKLIAPTQGFVHFGDDMGNEWNHSDDQLAFDCYFVLHRYAFTEELKSKYAAAIRDHWELEKRERNPIWNYVLGSTGDPDCDLAGAAWTLRHFPWDMVSWRVENSHRLDITKLPENFRREQLEELLPADERQITRWNTHPFVLDGGDNGQTEFAGDEFLLPYWMGRYLRLLE